MEPAIQGVATEEMLLSFLPLFSAEGRPINAASILPGLLRDFGDLADVLAEIGPRRVLVAGGVGPTMPAIPSIQVTEEPFTRDPRVLDQLDQSRVGCLAMIRRATRSGSRMLGEVFCRVGTAHHPRLNTGGRRLPYENIYVQPGTALPRRLRSGWGWGDFGFGTPLTHVKNSADVMFPIAQR